MHQRDFNEAISWWVATGICKKMEQDVRRSIVGNSYWIPQLMQGEVPLDIYHVMLSFMVLIFGLVLSIFFFLVELLKNKFLDANIANTSPITQEKKKVVGMVPVSS